VLIIADDVINIQMIQQILASSGHNLDIAQDANKGVAMVTKRINLTRSGVKMYKLIILDYSMPGLDGPIVTGILNKLV